MENRRADTDKRDRDEDEREIRSDRKQDEADESGCHPERERERLRMFVRERADDGLEQRSGELVRQRDQPDVAVVQSQRRFQDRINRGDQRLERVVYEMGEAQREENAEHRRGRWRRWFDIVVHASRWTVRGRFTGGSHRDTLNALGPRVAGISNLSSIEAEKLI